MILGTFVAYDPTTDMLAPSIDGFSAGVGADGSDLYVGTGGSQDCMQSPVPARIFINPPTPGAYM